MAKRIRCKPLTTKSVRRALDMLEAERPYSEICRTLGISVATLGRIKSAGAGKFNAGNQHIKALLKDDIAQEHTPPQKKDTHCMGLVDQLTEMESNLVKLHTQIQNLKKFF